MKKVQDWLKRNKEELLFGWGMIGTAISIVLILFVSMVIAMSNDLVGRVEKEVAEKETMEKALEDKTKEAAYYYTMYDSLIQSYEDVIPKGQYIQDVEYLESVILKLRETCGAECDGI